MIDNIKAVIDDAGLLVLTIDLSKVGTESASGKSMVKATTRGNKSIRELISNAPEEFANVKVGINVYEKVKKE